MSPKGREAPISEGSVSGHERTLHLLVNLRPVSGQNVAFDVHATRRLDLQPVPNSSCRTEATGALRHDAFHLEAPGLLMSPLALQLDGKERPNPR
jgi:hypothetical protein